MGERRDCPEPDCRWDGGVGGSCPLDRSFILGRREEQMLKLKLQSFIGKDPDARKD